jgi:hypothetical protein
MVLIEKTIGGIVRAVVAVYLLGFLVSLRDNTDRG